jgi:general transcription factor IIIA
LCTYLGCNKKFTKPGNLKIHISTAHKGERFICCTFDISDQPDVGHFNTADACGKDFVSKASLVDHLRTAHLGLPSTVNANRQKSRVSKDHEFETDNDEEEDEEGEEDEPPKRHPKKRGWKTQPGGMNDMPANADSNPSFSAFEDAFQLPEGDGQGYSPGFVGGMGMEEGREAIDALYDQADIDWEIQRRSLEGGAFWIGAEEAQNDFRDGPTDEWTQEEMEIRRLVGDD